MNTKEKIDKYSFSVQTPRDLVIVKGKGAKVWDENGNEYIDCVSGIGVANVGHCNETVVKAIEKQTENLITCYGAFYNDTRACAMEKLISVVPKGLNRVFFCNSGTEAVEGAIKFARFTTKKTDFISFMKGFHGRTLGSLSATHNPKHKNDFLPTVPGFVHVPYNNIEKLSEAVTENTAGIILELVQGEGGVNIANKDFVKKVRELCDEKGIILIFDEIQTGFCRTGKFFACEHYDVTPDIMCLSKAMAGGVPMGAVVCSDKIIAPIGRHGTTFGGNPLACAAAIATIDFMLDNDLAKQSLDKGAYFMNEFEKHDLAKVRNVRGIGLMIGIELKEKCRPYISALQKKGIIASPAGTTVLRLLPPLTISTEELDAVIKALVEVLE